MPTPHSANLEEAFQELRARLGQSDALNPAHSDPIFYFVYQPAQLLEVKRRLPAWIAALKHDGLTIERVSLSDLVWDLVDQSGRWETWLQLESGADIQELNEAIRDVLRSDHALVNRVAERVSQSRERTAVFVTETELLHPYFRTRAIEGMLTNKVKVPLVFFYAGERKGQYGLSFLGFYPEDGNYRSTLIGGL